MRPNMKTCVICGKKFKSPPSDATVTCSKKCSSERRRRQCMEAPSKMITKKCVICGMEFKVQPAAAGRYSTCSAACRAEYSRRRTTERRAAEKIWRKCVICGRAFSVPPSASDIKTCRDPECSRALRVLNGKTLWEGEKIKKGLADSEICQPDERNCRAKEWNLRDPNGNCYIFRNLRYFVRTHVELFTDDELTATKNNSTVAADKLAKLRPGCSGQVERWHGWTWKN